MTAHLVPCRARRDRERHKQKNPSHVNRSRQIKTNTPKYLCWHWLSLYKSTMANNSSADVQGSDNRIPLLLQWLLPKPAENKPAVGTGTQETLRRCMARRKRMFFGLPCLIRRPIVVIIGVMKKETPILLYTKIAGEMEIKSLVIAGG
ncbi:hypothetical protein OIU74_008367 [Salix koriyanagi]|uniref:Uncharacterized protein n=1 Tax=Salix koriyanagi TaxID=2511006 RepID=A0A9Q0Z7C4_9ROSI|nr:hypothetical protein OIU74_008367 [Salix koriyanagi]